MTADENFLRLQIKERSEASATNALTVRDYFAAAALTGICANESITKNMTERDMAEMAVESADALLAELEKGKESA